MNPSIILAGQTPDFLGTIDRANTAAARQNGFQRENALAQMMQQYGPGIVSGDQNAINALARFDPQAALGVQNTRLGMDATRQRMQVLSAEEERAAATYAQGLSDRDAAAQAAKIEEGVKMGMSARSAQEWDAIMSRVSPELVGMFDQRDMVANKYMSMAEILKSRSGSGFRQATPEEAMGYGAQGGQFGPDGRFYPINPPSGMSVEAGPDGQLRVVQGPGAGSQKPFTEGQSKDNVYSTRARGALEAFEPVADSLTSRGERAAEYVPLGIGREFQSDNFQVAQQAGTEFLQAILRKDTGAAITQDETESYGRVYLPQPGDGEAVLSAKREARIRAVNALESGMSPAQMLARDSALIQAARESAGAKPANMATPDSGAVEDGYRFIGGDPADPNNWQKVE